MSACMCTHTNGYVSTYVQPYLQACIFIYTYIFMHLLTALSFCEVFIQASLCMQTSTQRSACVFYTNPSSPSAISLNILINAFNVE